MDDIKGTVADETINATAVSATTGAAITDLSSGDKIDGGAGTDTLNVTLTADNNSLTGVTVSNVEVVNITGANNTAASTSAPSAASAGAKQVQVLDIANLSLEAEQQTIDFVGTVASGTTVATTINGVAVTATTVAADTGTAIATKLAAAINTAANAATAGTALAGITASATSGVVTLDFPVTAGNAKAPTVTGGVTGSATISESKASSAEVQTVKIDVSGAAVATDTLTYANLGSTAFVYTVPAGGFAATTTGEGLIAADVASAVNTAIGAGATGVDLLDRAEVSGDTVTFVYKVASGDASAVTQTLAQVGAGSSFASAASVITEANKGGQVDLTVSINGANYAATAVVDPAVLSSTEATALAAQNASKNSARTAIKTVLDAALGDGVTVGNSDEAGEIKLTSATTGTAIPSISATGRDSATNLISADSADAATVANAEKTSASGAVAQQVQYTVAGTVATTDTFTLYVDGVSYGTLKPAAGTPASAATGIAAAINTVLGTGTAIAVGGSVTITAPVAGAALPVISIGNSIAAGTITRADLRDNVDVLGTTTTTGAASVSGASFTGSEQVWLVGADSNETNLTVTTQTAGLNGVTGLDNKITFGASGALAVKGSAGTVDIAGAATVLAISGTGTATGGIELTNATPTTTAAALDTITVSTSGATSLDVSALTNLSSVTSTGAGGVTIDPAAAATKFASFTSGEGADAVRLNTATILDNTLTADDETVNASASTGGGNDTIRVNTSGDGTTTVDSGEGNDSVRLTAVSDGVATIDTGAGNDTVYLDLAIGGSPNMSVSAGEGTDTLVMAGGTLTAVDYLRLNTALSGFESVKFVTSASGVIDASLLDIGSLSGFTFTNGDATQNTISGISGQKLTLTNAAAVETATSFMPTSSATSASGLKATADDYKQGASIVPTVYGEALDVAVSGNSTVALTLAGSAATVGVTATGAATAAKSIAPTVTLGAAASDLVSLTVNLNSARGTSTNAASEYMASFDAGTIVDASATAWNQHLEALSSLTVTGAGVFTVNNGTANKELVSLTTIDVSGMEAFSNLDTDGTLTDNVNRSTSSITLNSKVSEVVNLGGAKDTVVTGSSVATMDVVIGFQLSASATSATTVDTDRSDVLDLPGSLTFVAFETDATTLSGALTDAGAETDANLVFNFGGDTYVYSDRGSVQGYTAVAGFDDGDYVVRLVGNYDVDLLIGVVG